MLQTLYANRPEVQLAALRLWRFYARDCVTELLSPDLDSFKRVNSIADLVNLDFCEFAEFEIAINQLELATGNLILTQVEGAAGPPVELATRSFEVKAARIADEVSRFADLLESIANGEADDISDGDGWQTRTAAGLLVARLQALLNYGDLDFADCDFPTLERLKGLWSLLKQLDFGDHSDRPKEYRGALFLPHELGPFQIGPNEFIPDQVLRGADEPYEILNISLEVKLAAARAVKLATRQIGSSARERRLASRALSSLSEGSTTTKRKRWGQFPTELRRYARDLASDSATPVVKQLAQQDDPSSSLSVPEHPQAFREKLFPRGIPGDQNLVDCIILLDSKRDGKTADMVWLLEFFDSNEAAAKRMQVRIRKARRDGVTNLPATTGLRHRRSKRSGQSS
ncbi:hypothetical protein [Lacipirellula sp.]|uniref:hypothetical protein n=1 Tax=Lacipirellula sp. TaxID=2691419 RepID=UPI003D11C8C1